MKLNKYFVQVAGGYALGVNNLAEAILAAWGDRAAIGGFGYPSIVGEFFECHTDEYVWNSDTLDYEEEETKYLLESIRDKDVLVYERQEDGTYQDITNDLLKTVVNQVLDQVIAVQGELNA